MIRLYGIPNCDTMKKARRWLDEQGIVHEFHDYRKQGIDEARLRQWLQQVSWETLLNRRGMMWRKLPEATRAAMDEVLAIETMLQTPSIIKRPVLEHDAGLLVGFDPQVWAERLGR